MVIRLQGEKEVLLRKLEKADGKLLYDYCANLSLSTKEKFKPHLFEWDTIQDICKNASSKETDSYIGELLATKQIIAYFIIRFGVSSNDKKRLDSNFDGIKKICSFAPSISDSFQGSGLASILFDFIKLDLINMNVAKVILLGGVQKDNSRAISFYKKMGFLVESEFERYGVINYAMSIALKNKL
jgi:ribosomal protein S18 acetylase RimI-like enzyme